MYIYIIRNVMCVHVRNTYQPPITHILCKRNKIAKKTFFNSSSSIRDFTITQYECMKRFLEKFIASYWAVFLVMYTGRRRHVTHYTYIKG